MVFCDRPTLDAVTLCGQGRVLIPIEQTRMTYPDGNCYHACLASVLEIPLSEVPDYSNEPGNATWHRWQDWLEQRNLPLIGWNHPISKDRRVVDDVLRGYSIVTVRYDLPKGPSKHSCVALDGKIVWNPHPSRDRIEHDGIENWEVFRVIDPSKPMLMDQRAI